MRKVKMTSVFESPHSLFFMILVEIFVSVEYNMMYQKLNVKTGGAR